MSENEILDKLTAIFREVFNDDELNVSMELTADEIDEWSSISQMLMVTEVERAFGISFLLKEVALMNSVASIVELINIKLSD